MRHKVVTLLKAAGCFFAATALGSAAMGQGAPSVSLEDQLKAQYQLVRMGGDSNGAAVIEAGTILDIQKGGILGVPYGNVAMAAHYQDGVLKPPPAATNNTATSMASKACKLWGRCSGAQGQAAGQTTSRLFQVGEKVYPSKIEVNPSKDTVTLGLVACDSCNNTSPTTFYKSQVVFQFAKGSLATMSPSQVEDTIAQVFTIDDNANNQNGGGNGGGDQQQAQGGQGNQGGGGQGGQGGGQQQAQQQQQQQAPASIEKGQTIDQVVNAWGQPQKVVNLGAKQIYIYQDAKITFIGGKVSDVQ